MPRSYADPNPKAAPVPSAPPVEVVLMVAHSWPIAGQVADKICRLISNICQSVIKYCLGRSHFRRRCLHLRSLAPAQVHSPKMEKGKQEEDLHRQISIDTCIKMFNYFRSKPSFIFLFTRLSNLKLGCNMRTHEKGNYISKITYPWVFTHARVSLKLILA